MFFVRLLDLKWKFILPVTIMKALCKALGAFSQAHLELPLKHPISSSSSIVVQPISLHGFRRGGFHALCLLQLLQHLLVKPLAWLGIKGNLELEGSSLEIWRTSVALDHKLQYVGCWVIFYEMNMREMFHPQWASLKSCPSLHIPGHWNIWYR